MTRARGSTRRPLWATCLAAALALLAWFRVAQGAGFEVPLALGELVDAADAVAVGTIEQVAISTFALRADEVVAGRLPGPRIEVAKFRPPEASPRWAPYCAGQRVLIFVAAPRSSAGTWEILGRIGEGEIPLDAEYAYFHSRHVSSLPADYYRLDERTVYLQRFERAATIDALRSYPPCVEWIDADRPGRRKARIGCSAAELAAYGGRSVLHAFLVSEAEQSARSPRP